MDCSFFQAASDLQMIQSTGSRGEDQMTQVARGVCHSPIGGSVVLASSLFHPESKSVVASGSNGSEKVLWDKT